MADQNSSNGVEIFSGIQNESKLDLKVDVQTLIDAAKIPLEMTYEARIKVDAAALKAKEKKVAEASKAYEDEAAKRDDPLITDRIDAFRSAIEKIRKTLVAVSDSVELGDVQVDVSNFQYNDAADTRRFSVKAFVPHSSTQSDKAKDDGYGVRDSGVAIQATICVPFTAEQKALKKTLDDLSAEYAELKTAWTALVKEKEEAVRTAERLARTKYASVALTSISGGTDLVNKVYDDTFYLNLRSSLTQLGLTELVDSGLLPGSGSSSLKAIDAPKASKQAK